MAAAALPLKSKGRTGFSAFRRGRRRSALLYSPVTTSLALRLDGAGATSLLACPCALRPRTPAHRDRPSSSLRLAYGACRHWPGGDLTTLFCRLLAVCPSRGAKGITEAPSLGARTFTCSPWPSPSKWTGGCLLPTLRSRTCVLGFSDSDRLRAARLLRIRTQRWRTPPHPPHVVRLPAPAP